MMSPAAATAMILEGIIILAVLVLGIITQYKKHTHFDALSNIHENGDL